MKSLLFTLFFSCLSVVVTAGSMENEIFRLINDYRETKKLPALKMNSAINAAAEKHSRNMASGRVGFGHGGFDSRIDKLLKGIKGANAGAENVAYGSRTAADVVKLWINSSGHRKNIRGKYTLTGVGISRSNKGTLYFTQIFINTK